MYVYVCTKILCVVMVELLAVLATVLLENTLNKTVCDGPGAGLIQAKSLELGYR